MGNSKTNLADKFIKTRYPDEEWREYDREETDEAIEKAEFILDRIKKFLEERHAH